MNTNDWETGANEQPDDFNDRDGLPSWVLRKQERETLADPDDAHVERRVASKPLRLVGTPQPRVQGDAAGRKAQPVCTGCLDYFPDALLEVAALSKIGNDQHNPGQPLHWDKSKSTDEPDALLRHLIDRGTRDVDGVRHSAKVAWRALALLQREIEAERSR